MRYVLSHEFRHYLTSAWRIPIPIPKGRKEARRKAEEMSADEFAQSVTGLRDTEARDLARRVGL